MRNQASISMLLHLLIACTLSRTYTDCSKVDIENLKGHYLWKRAVEFENAKLGIVKPEEAKPEEVKVEVINLEEEIKKVKEKRLYQGPIYYYDFKFMFRTVVIYESTEFENTFKEMLNLYGYLRYNYIADLNSRIEDETLRFKPSDIYAPINLDKYSEKFRKNADKELLSIEKITLRLNDVYEYFRDSGLINNLNHSPLKFVLKSVVKTFDEKVPKEERIPTKDNLSTFGELIIKYAEYFWHSHELI